MIDPIVPAVFIFYMNPHSHVFPKDQTSRGLFGAVTVRLIFFRAVNAVQPDTLRLVVMHDRDGIAVLN